MSNSSDKMKELKQKIDDLENFTISKNNFNIIDEKVTFLSYLEKNLHIKSFFN